MHTAASNQSGDAGQYGAGASGYAPSNGQLGASDYSTAPGQSNGSSATSGYGSAAANASDAQPAADLPPMGWYPDPAGSSQERYWDGAQWTQNLRPSEPQPGLTQQQDWRSNGAQYPLGAQDSYATDGRGPVYGGNPYGAAPGGVVPYGAAPYGGAGHGAAPYGGYASAIAPVGPTTADGVPLAGWWWRVLASIIDSFALSLVSQMLQAPFMAKITYGMTLWIEDMMRMAESGSPEILWPFDPRYGITGPLILMVVAIQLVTFLYGFLMLRYKGATLGHLACGLRVVPTDQGRAPEGLSWGQAGLRHAMYMLIGFVPLINIVNYLMAAFTDKRQTWHDMIAKTQVVKIR